MIKETQQLLIAILGIVAIICILKDYPIEVLTTIIGILGGFLMGNRFIVDDQSITVQEDNEEDDTDVQ